MGNAETKKQDAADNEDQGESIDDLNKWVLDNIKKKECTFVFPQDVSGGDVCGCGYTKEKHVTDTSSAKVQPGTTWNPHEHVKEFKSDAHGDLTFTGTTLTSAKYVRASCDTKPSVLYELMTEKWHLRVPRLLISVIGGAKNFIISARLKNQFSHGLVRAAQSTGAWIITGGTHSGVMKHVGEAIRDFSGGQQNSQITLIGIAPWGIIHNQSSLVSEAGGVPALYPMDESSQGQLCCLDNNHTHFILVDDGTYGRYGAETPLRTQLEKFISEQTMHKKDIQIPTVCVVLGGGPETLKTIHSNNTPCVIVKGSGGMADVIAQVAQEAKHSSSEINDNLIKEKLRDFFQDSYNSFTDSQIIEWSKKIKDIVRMDSLLTILREERDGDHGMDVDILQALLKASRRTDDYGKENWGHQLKLAMTWNRTDIAESQIFTQDQALKRSDLHPSLTLALIENKPSFVRLFLKLGVSLQEYLTRGRLIYLYNNTDPDSLIHRKLERLVKKGNEKEPVLNHVSRLLEELLGDYTKPLYSKNPLDTNNDSSGSTKEDTEIQECDSKKNPENPQEIIHMTQQKTYGTINQEDPQETSPLQTNGSMKNHEDPQKKDHPVRDLLIWCIVQNRAELADTFWNLTDDCVTGALACNKILKALAKEEKRTETMEEMTALANLYEERALGVFSECYRSNNKKAKDLLIRASHKWGKTTALELAQEAQALLFMSQGGVQEFLTKIWWGELSVDNGFLQILLCMLFFPLIYSGLISFRKETSKKQSTEQSKHQDSNDENKRKETSQKQSTEQSKHQDTSDKAKSSKPYSCFEKLMAFFNAPIVKFYYNVVSYIGFLWLFAYVLMIDFQNTPSWREYLLYVWVFSIFCEELRQAFYDPENRGFVKKSIQYISEFWNQVDIMALGLFALGLICRLFHSQTGYLGRIFLSLDFMIFCVRLMHIFTISRVLGPKIIMLRRMVKDVFFFLFLLGIWIVSYGVAKQAILIDNEERVDWIFRNVLYQPYLALFGTMPPDVDGMSYDFTKCTADGSSPNLTKCANNDNHGNTTFPQWLSLLLLSVYLLMANILLLNLLIAMFSHRFGQVQSQTDQIWKFYRFGLIKEYSERPAAPPPLILFIHCYLLVKLCIAKPTKSNNMLRKEVDEKQESPLLSWESYRRDIYQQMKQQRGEQSQENLVKNTAERVSSVLQLLRTESGGNGSQLEGRLSAMEAQMGRSSQELKGMLSTIEEQMGLSSQELKGRLYQMEEQMSWMVSAMNRLSRRMGILDE